MKATLIQDSKSKKRHPKKTLDVKPILALLPDDAAI
jgi:hypothetical protein